MILIDRNLLYPANTLEAAILPRAISLYQLQAFKPDEPTIRLRVAMEGLERLDDENISRRLFAFALVASRWAPLPMWLIMRKMAAAMLAGRHPSAVWAEMRQEFMDTDQQGANFQYHVFQMMEIGTANRMENLLVYSSGYRCKSGEAARVSRVEEQWALLLEMFGDDSALFKERDLTSIKDGWW